MLSDLRQRKFTAWFKLQDANGNGVVEKDDYELVSKKHAENFQLASDSPKYAEAHGTLMGLWRALEDSADANRDGQVTHEEFLSALEFITGNGFLYKTV